MIRPHKAVHFYWGNSVCSSISKGHTALTMPYLINVTSLWSIHGFKVTESFGSILSPNHHYSPFQLFFSILLSNTVNCKLGNTSVYKMMKTTVKLSEVIIVYFKRPHRNTFMGSHFFSRQKQSTIRSALACCHTEPGAERLAEGAELKPWRCCHCWWRKLRWNG